MNTAQQLVNDYAAAIGEPAPRYLADAARRVFNGEDAAPVHHDEVAFMREVIEDHEKDPGALREFFDSLKAGAVYGHQVNNVPCPFFWENIGIHDGWIKWNHYGASANRVTMHDLAFVVFDIFKTTPREFMAEYERS